MKVITAYPVIKVTNGVAEEVSNARGGGGRRGGGGGRRGGFARPSRRGGGVPARRWRGGYRRRAPIYWGGVALWWNGAYWVDSGGQCYEKTYAGFVPVDCNKIPSVALGL